MKLATAAGTALVLHNDNLKTMAFGPGHYPESYTFTAPGVKAMGEDYDERLDVYCHQSDDGATCYDAIRVLALSGEPDSLRYPDPALVASKGPAAIARVMASVVAGHTHSGDLAFAIRVFNSATWQHKHWEEAQEDLDAAQARILADIFQIR